MKKSRFFSVLLFVSLLFVLLPATAKAIWEVPVAPGETFRWVFVTSQSTDATSSDIETYNTFINDFVMAPLAYTPISGVAGKYFLGDITWKAIASTEGVDAIVNIGGNTSAPIYDPAGQRIEDSTVAMTDGLLLYYLARNENGDQWLPEFVWTGTQNNLTGKPGYTLGCDLAVVGSIVIWGQWINNTINNTNDPFPLYAISEVLTVPALIPAPGALILAATGLLSLLGFRRLRRKDQE